MKVGLAVLIVTFILYIAGIPRPAVEKTDVSSYWHLKVNDYLGQLRETGAEGGGWSWLSQLNRGDFLNFLPIAFLAAVTVICYLTIIPILLKQKDSIYVVLVILEVLVLSLAASGVLPSGGH
ncbi:MAG: hypothetical protein IBX61_04730 [Thermoleophilia bacterium]|nr:hypothetical protein [Thermoleophilia bacterium]